jgi:hypothetical protein
VFFIAATILMTWPLVTDLPHSISDPGDPYFSAWTLHWDWKQTFHDPRHLFDANIFYPARWSLAFSENMWGVSLVGFPLYFAGLPSITIYNVLFVLGIALSGFAAWLFASELTADRVAAIVAGVFYAFVPFRFEHLAHIHIQWGGFIPLFLLYLRRYFQSRRIRDLVLFSLFFVWNGLVGIQYTVIGTVALTLMILIKTTKFNLWTSLDHWCRLAAAIVISGLVLLPFYAPYVHASRRYKLTRRLGDVAVYSAHWSSFLAAGSRNRMYGSLTARFDTPECQLFFGIVVPALSIAGLLLLFRRRERAAVGQITGHRGLRALDATILFLVLVRVAFIITGAIRVGGFFSMREPFRLSLLITLLIGVRLAIAFPAFLKNENLGDFIRNGPWSDDVIWALALVAFGIILPLGANAFPYRELFEIFPFVFRAIRVPARQVVLAHIGLGILAAFGVSLWRRRSRGLARIVIPVICTCAAFLEYRAAPISYFKADTAPLALSDWLKRRVFSGSIAELPMKWYDHIEYVYRTIEHGHPIVNGYSSFSPPDFERLTRIFTSSPIASEAWDFFHRDEVRFLVFHPRKATGAEIAAITSFLRSGIEEGRLRPAAFFEDIHDKSLVFALAENGISPFTPDTAAGKQIMDFLEHPDSPQRPPVGWNDAPTNGQRIRGPILFGSGWVASESGIAHVVVSLDGHEIGNATYGIERRDVSSVKPEVPCGAYCGYKFHIVGARPGRHHLSVRFVGKDGKDASPPGADIWVTE